MTIDITKNLQTRNGLAVRVLASDIDNATFPIAAAVSGTLGTEKVFQYTATGTINTDATPSPYDLVQVPVMRTDYVNFYGISGNEVFATLREATANAAPSRIAVLVITYTDDIVTGITLG